ncbi:hypothetical protein L2D01_05320 [Hyphomonadaceae bacterium ML37]|nr:hypothetical protein L2D01_05320 [Hyphomonadaceae bacterium ML37]
MDLLERLEVDQTFMLCRSELNIPARQFEITGIKRLGQDIVDPLAGHFAAPIFGETGVRFKKAHHFGLRRKPLVRVALKPFLDHRSQWFVPNEHFALAAHTLESIAERSLEYPVAIRCTGTHPVEGLLAVLLALVLRHAR